MKPVYSAIFMVSFILLLGACGDNSTSSISSDNGTQSGTSYEAQAAYESGLQEGAIVFGAWCAPCHGDYGTAGIAGAANLATSRIDSAMMMQVLQHGRNGMPPFSGKLTEDKLKLVINYAYSLRK